MRETGSGALRLRRRQSSLAVVVIGAAAAAGSGDDDTTTGCTSGGTGGTGGAICYPGLANVPGVRVVVAPAARVAARTFRACAR